MSLNRSRRRRIIPFELDNILLSPHNAALTDEALVAMATQSAQGIVDCLAERKPRYVVNSEVLKK